MDLISAIGAAGLGGAASVPNESGWEGVGQNVARLFGGGSRPDAYAQGATRGADLQKKMLEARKLRDEAVAREGFRERAHGALSSQMSPEQIDLLVDTTIGGMGSDFNQTTQGFGHLSTQQMRQQAAAESDPALQNQILAAIEGKPRDLTKISGETAYNPTLAPDQQTLGVTTVGQQNLANRTAVAVSQIGRNNATGAAALQRAGTYAQSVGARGPGGKLTQLEVEAGKRAMANVDDDYAGKIQSAKTEDERIRLGRERDARLAAIAKDGPMSGGATTVVEPATGRPVGEAVRQTLRPGRAGKSNGVYRPRTDADYNAIPSGALFVDPDDGRTYRKD